MSGRKPVIVVIGGTYIDMAVKCQQVPQPGHSVKGSALSYVIAGPGPSQAVEAALCGCEVYLISKVGGDPFAKMAIEGLSERGVKTKLIYTAEAQNTGVVFTLVDSKGENTTCIYTGANGSLSPKDVDAAEQIILEADVCLIHGRLPQKSITRAIQSARIHNTKIILNPARPIEQPKRASVDLPPEYFSVDVLIPNLYEAADITDKTDTGIRTAKLIGSDLVARGVGCAVITMGKRGCMVVDRRSADHIPAFDVELVDQAGRGDAFAGALAAFYAGGE